MPQTSWDIVLERPVPCHVHVCGICGRPVRCFKLCHIFGDGPDGVPRGTASACSAACQKSEYSILFEAWDPTDLAHTMPLYNR